MQLILRRTQTELRYRSAICRDFADVHRQGDLKNCEDCLP